MVLNSKFWIITKREYISRIRSKGFIISTILGPILILIITILPAVIKILSTEDTEMKIFILDNTSQKVGENIILKAPSKFLLTNENIQVLNKKIISGDIDAYIYLDDKVFETYKIPVFTKGGGGIGFIELISNVVGDELRKQNLKKVGLPNDIIELIEKDFKIDTRKVTKEGLKKDYSTFYSVLGYIMAFFVYIMLAIYGSSVMRGVIEEKSNRIVEILVSSAKPTDILFGKVVGIGAVGLTQIIIWIFLGLIILSVLPNLILLIQPTNLSEIANISDQNIQNLQKFEIPDISIWLVLTLIFYFIAGYFLYSTLFAAIGSAVDQEQDAQYISTPLFIPLIFPILISTYLMSNPDGVFSVIFSLFPFFAPILMTMRIASTNVPFWQIFLSYILMILTFWLCIWISSKIYRVGILIYGKKPNYREIFRWFKEA